MDLSEFMFPVETRDVMIHDGSHTIIDTENSNTYLEGRHKALVRSDSNRLISIVKASYNVVPNEILINQLMRELVRLDTPFQVDDSHSFCTDARMRLMIRFPELYLRDSESEIALSLFLENSYDLSCGVRYYFGAIRKVCTNGMVFGKVIKQYYAKHTSGFELDDLHDVLNEVHDQFPTIKSRIMQLDSTPVDKSIAEKVEKDLGKRLAAEVLTEQDILRISQWQLYNRITFEISHNVDQEQRARYQKNVSKIFQL